MYEFGNVSARAGAANAVTRAIARKIFFIGVVLSGLG
jgi:hypothetical protein